MQKTDDSVTCQLRTYVRQADVSNSAWIYGTRRSRKMHRWALNELLVPLAFTGLCVKYYGRHQWA